MFKNINLNNLELSLENPRLALAYDEKEVIENMVKDQRKKIYNLATDIVENGLNPLDFIAVYPSNVANHYIVAEGNRRCTALKLLQKPEILYDLDQSLYQSFLKLSKKYSVIEDIDCYIFKSENDPKLAHWIEIKHLGENEGRGTAKWSAIQKARYDQNTKGQNKFLDFLYEMERNNILTLVESGSITKTNWERILRDYGLKFLNMGKGDDKYEIPYDDLEEFKKKMKAIHRKLNNQTVAVKK